MDAALDMWNERACLSVIKERSSKQKLDLKLVGRPCSAFCQTRTPNNDRPTTYDADEEGAQVVHVADVDDG